MRIYKGTQITVGGCGKRERERERRTSASEEIYTANIMRCRVDCKCQRKERK